MAPLPPGERPLYSLSLRERVGVRVFTRRRSLVSLGQANPIDRPPAHAHLHGRSFAICRQMTTIGSKPTTTIAIDAVEASASRSSDASV